MKLSKEDQKMLDEYEEELNHKGKLSEEEIMSLISLMETNPYDSMRSLMDNYLPYAYKIALKYHHPRLTLLDFVHAANEGLEIAITTGSYHDINSLQKAIEETINDSIKLMLSYMD